MSIPPDRSLLVFDRLPEFPFNWYYHPEFELTLTVGSRGMRFVGDHVGRYEDGDLVLIAPNLPHAFQFLALIGEASQHRAAVSWFAQGWIEGLIRAVSELGQISGLLAQARSGLRFGLATAYRLRGRILKLAELDALAQVMTLQSLLAELAAEPDRMPLASGEVSVSDLPRDRLRLRKVLYHLDGHYDRSLRLQPLCDLVHLTES